MVFSALGWSQLILKKKKKSTQKKPLKQVILSILHILKKTWDLKLSNLSEDPAKSRAIILTKVFIRSQGKASA